MSNQQIDRRRFLIGAAMIAASQRPPFSDGQSIFVDGREYVLTDIIAPSTTPLSGPPEPGADFAKAILNEALLRGSPTSDAAASTDRWGRIGGAVRWIVAAGRETTLQEILVAEGAARVAPQSDDYEFIDRCFAAEKIARAAQLGLWKYDHYRSRNANIPEIAYGFQIYAGEIRDAGDHGGRVYFNFGDDFRSDFTASVSRAAFRRWKSKLDPATAIGGRAEVRGYVERINGPSIELLHERQLRLS
jgi:endonuclease YncB( thermonuclease family)